MSTQIQSTNRPAYPCVMHTRSFILQFLTFAAIAIGFVNTAFVNTAKAQLIPERLYYGIGQRIPITVKVPDAFVGEVTIRIYNPATQEWTHQVPAAAGRVDLASLLPHLWEEKSHAVIYAQLELDSIPTGAPLVLQPLITPNRAVLVDPGTMRLTEDPKGHVTFEDQRLKALSVQNQTTLRKITFSGYRIYIDQEIIMKTTLGDIVYRLRPDAAPNTAYNFLHLVQGGFYTNIIFHRVVAARPDGSPFVIQVGDLSGTGSGGPGYMIDLENSTLPHDFGVLSMARDTNPDTNGSQVFVCLSKIGTSFLDGRYTAFAQAIQGATVIKAIAAVPVGNQDRPFDPPLIKECIARDAPPIQDWFPPLSETDSQPESKAPSLPLPDR